MSALVLRFVRNMKCILTGKERVGGEVTLLEVRNSELEWLKFEQHFIIQDSKFQKQKHSLNLYFDENDILRSQTHINQIKGVLLQESQPILLRSNSYFTELIALKCHKEVKHSGHKSTLNRIRSAELFKAYILVFTCATTQCTHLELVTNFTTETYLRLKDLFPEEASHNLFQRV